MFARKVSMHLKAECAGEFIKKMETEVIPLLRKQKGFLDEITLFPQSGKEVYVYTFRENSADVEKYDHGALRVHTYMVANSTFHKMASAVAS